MALSRKFKAPSRTDDEQWRKVEFLYSRGFRFQTVRDRTGMAVRYPASLEAARDFVRRYDPGKRPENYAWAAASPSEQNRAWYERLFRRAQKRLLKESRVRRAKR